MTEMMKHAPETAVLLQALSKGLREEGISGISYSLEETRRRTTSVRGGMSYTRTDAEDSLLVIKGCVDGREVSVSFTEFPDAKTAAHMLQENAAVMAAANAESGADTQLSEKRDEQQLQKRAEKETGAFAKEAEADEQAVSGAADLADFETHEAVETVLLDAERAAFALPETALVDLCRYEQEQKLVRLFSENGSILLSDASGYRCMRTAVIAKAERAAADRPNEREESTEYTFGCRYGSSVGDTKAAALCRETAELAAGGLFGASLPSGVYPAVLKNSVVAELLEAYLPAFYAENLKEGQSALCGLKGKAAAADFLSLREVPFLSGGRVTRRVDDEGTPVREKYLLKNGIFETALSKRGSTPEEDGESTGNGFRPDAQSDIGTGVTNVLLLADAEHTKPLSELLSAMQDGLYVTAIDGTFAGTDAKKGSFSLIARGRVVRGGRLCESFREVTIAGSFFEMLLQAKALGDEPAATAPDLACVLAPALFAGDLVVSGV
ncbi:MAG: metallopeptidase TldD-related protein [Eubacteriales bacterium]|nr:metallopeptidase TldD-related protein [Eubacteriales bacterium]